MSDVLPLIFVAVLLPLLLAGIWWAVIYNRFVRLRQHLQESWSDIDVELKRRHDLIPNLVETVRGYATHEKETLGNVIAARSEAMRERQAPANARRLGERETQIQRHVGRLLAIAETYPQLKTDRHFLELQQELALTEDRLAAARRFYNGNVRELNSLREAFPTSIVASAHGVAAAQYFEMPDHAERVAPRVSL